MDRRRLATIPAADHSIGRHSGYKEEQTFGVVAGHRAMRSNKAGMEAGALEQREVLRQLDQPQSFVNGDVAGGKGCPPAANDSSEERSSGRTCE